MLKTITKKISCFSLLFLVVTPLLAEANTSKISLKEYLLQVRHCNLGVAGSSLLACGAKQRADEGKLIYKPSLFAEGQYLKDSYDPDWSPIAGTNSSLQSYKVGVSQTTPYGLQGKLYYNYQQQKINGLSPLINQQQLTASSPIAELDLPLGRNFAGRETRANAQLVTSQAKLTNFSERYKNQMLMAQAESIYWRLAVARSIVSKQIESLKRAIRIQQWTEERIQARLAEDSDLWQAEAAADAKKLDLQTAINDAEIAERDFNTLRGSNEAGVREELSSFNPSLIATLKLPCSPGIREDVRVAEQEANIQIANAKLGIEKNKPNIDLYASYAFNGNNPSSNEAIAESFTSNYPSTAVGIRLSVPLDVRQLNRDKAAYKKEIRAATYQFKQKVYENLRLWQNLTFKVESAKRRLDIANKLEQIQFKKLQAERQRLVYGKTTTFQVLMFEQDYANAQIASLAIQYEILELMAQLKTFGV